MSRVKLEIELDVTNSDQLRSHVAGSLCAIVGVTSCSITSLLVSGTCPTCKGIGKEERGSFRDPSKMLETTCSHCKGTKKTWQAVRRTG